MSEGTAAEGLGGSQGSFPALPELLSPAALRGFGTFRSSSVGPDEADVTHLSLKESSGTH